LHEVARARLDLDHAHDRRHIHDPDVLSRLDVRFPFGEAELDLDGSEISKIAEASTSN
jgi:hypothetical protein